MRIDAHRVLRCLDCAVALQVVFSKVHRAKGERWCIRPIRRCAGAWRVICSAMVHCSIALNYNLWNFLLCNVLFSWEEVSMLLVPLWLLLWWGDRIVSRSAFVIEHMRCWRDIHVRCLVIVLLILLTWSIHLLVLVWRRHHMACMKGTLELGTEDPTIDPMALEIPSAS